MAIDETGLINGELYTVLLNKNARGKKGSIAAIIKGTKASIVTEAINSKVSFSKRMEIKEITLDFSNSMDWIARQIAPNAIRTYDRFHAQKLVTEAVQSIRVKLRWEAMEQENESKETAKALGVKYKNKVYKNGDTKLQLLTRSRYLLFKPSEKWSSSQKQRAEILFKAYPELLEAYNYSIYFRNCYESGNKNYKMEDWIEKAKTSEIKPIITVAKTIESNLGGIKNYFENKATNAAIEGFHAKLKLFRQRVRGIKDAKFFFYRIFKCYA